MAGQKPPDDEPSTDRPAEDQTSSPPPAWGSGPAQPPQQPWAAPPPLNPVPGGMPAPPPYGPHGPSGSPPYGTPVMGPPPGGGRQEPPETQEWAPEPSNDPWRIPPQPIWDPSVTPSPPTDPAYGPVPAEPPYGPVREQPPVTPRFPAHGAGTGEQPTSSALDLPPSAMVPRSMPRPPMEPGQEPQPSGRQPVLPFDEPWRRQTPARSGGRGWTRPVLIGVAGVAVAGLIGGGVYVFTGGGTGGSDTSAAEPADRLFAVDPAAKTDGRDQELLGVATAGSTVVAVGGELGTDYRGQFFVSTDGGRSFRLADVRTADGQEPPYGDIPRRVVGTTGAWVALGTSPTGGVVWTSRDGTSWIRQPDDTGSSFNRPDRVEQIVRTSSGFVAVGDTSAKGDYSDASPVMWMSSDGCHWDRRTADQLGISAKVGILSLIDAAAVGDTVLAHGRNSTGKGTPADMTWRSTDGGHSWEPVSIPRPKGTSGLGVAAGPSGFIAARDLAGKGGKQPESSGVVLLSPDAKQWTQIGSIQVPGYHALQRIAGSDRGLAALVGTGNRLVVLRSTDGRSWTSSGDLPLIKKREVQGVAVTSRMTVIVGRDSTPNGNDALLQVRDTQGQSVPVDLFGVPGGDQPDQSVNGLASGRGLTLALGSTNGDGAIWSSRDGRTWQRAHATGDTLVHPGRQRVLGAALGGAGWLAVGYDGVVLKRPLVVMSPDGATWHGVDGGGLFKPSGGAQLVTAATAVGPAGYVIVGADGASAATWSTTDLTSWQRGTGASRGDLDGKPNGPRWMADVAGGSFGYVAVGGLNDPTAGTTANRRPVVWTSSDGRTWRMQQLPVPSGTLDATFAHVAAVGGWLLAAGTARTSSGTTVFAYTSADGGRTWQELRLPGTGTGTETALTALTATAKGFVVAAGAGKGGRSDVLLWTSADGRTWREEKPQGFGLSGRGDQWLTALTTNGGGLLGVGVTADHRGEQPTIWRRALP